MGQKETSDRRNDDNAALPEISDTIETFNISHEVPLLSNSLGPKFGYALSKNWDKIMNFDQKLFPENQWTQRKRPIRVNCSGRILLDLQKEQSTLSIQGENSIVGSNGSVIYFQKGKKVKGRKSKASKQKNKSDKANTEPRKVV